MVIQKHFDVCNVEKFISANGFIEPPMKITHGEELLLVKLQALACNFTKSNSAPWVFFTFFKLYKWYQIVQHITFTKQC